MKPEAAPEYPIVSQSDYENIEPDNENSKIIAEQGKVNSKGQNYRHGQYNLQVETLKTEETKEQYYSEENVMYNQIENGRVPQMDIKDQEIRKVVKPTGYQNVDNSPFGLGEQESQ